MPNIIDFNSYRRPELIFVLKDKKRTTLHVTSPTVQLVDELSANLNELQKALQGQDEEASRLVYHLAARLMSCNLDGLTITGEELAKKYGLNLEDMAIFYSAYMELIEEIKKAKN
jgi:hypothetical protein